MKFNVKKAEQDYVTDTAMSYRRLAEKYEVSARTIQKVGKKNNWVQKRKEYAEKVSRKFAEKQSEKEADKLAQLSTATDKAIALASKLVDEAAQDGITVNGLKEIANTLKILTGVQRDLNGILTKAELNALELAREKLQLERDRRGLDEGDGGECGIVMMPEVVSDVADDIVYEGDSDA
ncbi:MAG: hypothetical protein IJ168_08045 [Eubacterium sp.]|nr:hypothetical protein [Eubacterium sp.]